MSQVVKQDDGTYDIVGLPQVELDILTTFLGMPKPMMGEHDETAYALYLKLRAHGACKKEWVDG